MSYLSGNLKEQVVLDVARLIYGGGHDVECEAGWLSETIVGEYRGWLSRMVVKRGSFKGGIWEMAKAVAAARTLDR